MENNYREDYTYYLELRYSKIYKGKHSIMVIIPLSSIDDSNLLALVTSSHTNKILSKNIIYRFISNKDFYLNIFSKEQFSILSDIGYKFNTNEISTVKNLIKNYMIENELELLYLVKGRKETLKDIICKLTV